ncbi:helix-turn-helix domain-containing protein [Actinokineospora bangkokensis]|uniref:DNA-binding protein n=1 Tax=Actinokineospora bangkokensis TaxID=1193682 RepID=A0A1Q9LSP7_9PSEU|nr:helix-turn-helix domain-containing protein [Actinokineospora bangkokensis]OLR95021.1 DNA-binding protein [Actinokineospora bangkokensis]
MLSVEQVAERLGLHVRTVRGYIRDGKLRATRIGKQYRIAEDDLAALTGTPAPRRSVEATAVVEVEGIARHGADRLSTMLTAGVRGVRLQVVHDPDRSRVRVVLFGSPGEVADVLRVIDAVQGEL